MQGDEVVTDPSIASVMVLNTCAVTQEATRKSRKLVSSLHRKNPSARFVLTGCYAQENPARLAAMAGVDLVIGNQLKSELVSIVKDKFSSQEMPAAAMEAKSQLFPSHRTRAFIKVQDGCRNRCSFCIVTVLRGDEKSRALDDIVAEIHSLHQEGSQEAVLTGVHLGGYGSDIGTDLVELVSAILSRTQIPRLRLSSLEPWDIPENFFSLWQNPRLLPHLHLPLQSGTDSVLKRMSRRCSTDNFRKLVTEARVQIPSINITTDLIVGFPGETQDEWQQTVEFVAAMQFGHIHIFSYSPREGTKAARLPNPVDKATKKQRRQQIHDIALESKKDFLESNLGKTHSVLWENTIEQDGENWATGYTENWIRVRTKAMPDRPLKNTITSVQTQTAHGDYLIVSSL